MSSDNRGKTYRAQVVSTTKGNMKYGLGVFREGTIIEDAFHGERCD
jgi:hypothetical protein